MRLTSSLRTLLLYIRLLDEKKKFSEISFLFASKNTWISKLVNNGSVTRVSKIDVWNIERWLMIGNKSMFFAVRFLSICFLLWFVSLKDLKWNVSINEKGIMWNIKRNSWIGWKMIVYLSNIRSHKNMCSSCLWIYEGFSIGKSLQKCNCYKWKSCQVMSFAVT